MIRAERGGLDVNEGSSAPSIGLSTVLYVDPAGNDATARRGSEQFRYRTINAALLAVLAGDTLLLAPNNYVENVAMPNVDDLVIMAEGSALNTYITNAAVGHTVEWVAPGSGVHSAVFKGVSIVQTGAVAAVSLDGSAVADFLDGGIVFDQCLVSGGAVFARRVGEVDFRQCSSFGCSLVFTNVNGGLIDDSQFAAMTYTYDPTNPVPAGTQRPVSLTDHASVLTITLSGATKLSIDRTSFANFVDGSGLASFSVGGGNNTHVPQLVLDGTFFLGATINFPDPVYDGTLPSSLGMRGSVFHGPLNFQSQPGATVRMQATGRNASFEDTTPNSVVAGPFNDLDIRQCYFEQLALSSLSDGGGNKGTIDRDTHKINHRVLPATPASFDQPSIDPPFPAAVGQNDYGVLVERFDTGGGIPVDFCAFVTFQKTSIDFKVAQNTATPQTVQYTVIRRTAP